MPVPFTQTIKSAVMAVSTEIRIPLQSQIMASIAPTFHCPNLLDAMNTRLSQTMYATVGNVALYSNPAAAAEISNLALRYLTILASIISFPMDAHIVGSQLS